MSHKYFFWSSKNNHKKMWLISSRGGGSGGIPMQFRKYMFTSDSLSTLPSLWCYSPSDEFHFIQNPVFIKGPALSWGGYGSYVHEVICPFFVQWVAMHRLTINFVRTVRTEMVCCILARKEENPKWANIVLAQSAQGVGSGFFLPNWYRVLY